MEEEDRTVTDDNPNTDDPEICKKTGKPHNLDSMRFGFVWSPAPAETATERCKDCGMVRGRAHRVHLW